MSSHLQVVRCAFRGSTCVQKDAYYSQCKPPSRKRDVRDVDEGQSSRNEFNALLQEGRIYARRNRHDSRNLQHGSK